MIQGIPKISVVIICYNQENIIGRTLDSIVKQKDYIYEICVSDDNSLDNTWAVLNVYSERYPGLFKLNRNKENLGIFENEEISYSLVTGDIFYRIAGDDECMDGWFREVVTFIKKNNINYLEESVGIFGDTKCRYPKGDSFVTNNKIMGRGLSPSKLFVRGIAPIRAACYSKSVLKQYKNCALGRSYSVELVQEFQFHNATKKSFYIPTIGDIYNTRIGTSVKAEKKHIEENSRKFQYLYSFIQENNIKLDKKDMMHLSRVQPLLLKIRNQFSLISLFQLLFWEFRCYDINIGIKGLGIKRILFAIMIRFPHKTPISMKL